MLSYYGKTTKKPPNKPVSTWYDLDPRRDPRGLVGLGQLSVNSLRNITHSYKAKPKEGRLKPQEAKEGLLRELPKNAPLKGRFGSH